MNKGFLICKDTENGDRSYYCKRVSGITEFVKIRRFAHIFKKETDAEDYLKELMYLVTGKLSVISVSEGRIA